MANFNEKINFGTGFVLRDQECDYFIQKSDSMEEFERNVECLHFCKDPYRLYIQYKDAHPVESMAGHCFRWECVSPTRKRLNVRCLDCDSNDYFGDPRFDFITGAIFITDKYVVTYGDTWIEAVEIRGEHVVCNAYVCGRFVSEFRIQAEVFDRLFGLKENFPEQYAKPVKEENALIEEANGKDIVLKEFLGDLYDALMVLTNNDKQRVLKILEHYADKSGFFERIKEHIEYLESECPNR